MEHLQTADSHNKLSWYINTICFVVGGIGGAIQNSWFVDLSALGIIINAGFTIDKWYQMRKAIKSDKQQEVD
jgi:hypothetical protein